jgi:hypothetical protein
VNPELHLWFWIITAPIIKRRRRARHRMTEQDALVRHGADAMKVESSLEIRRNTGGSYTSDFMGE